MCGVNYATILIATRVVSKSDHKFIQKLCLNSEEFDGFFSQLKSCFDHEIVNEWELNVLHGVFRINVLKLHFVKI